MNVSILTGDCRAILPTLAAESVHCVVCSPPYWGLRDYQIEPSIWGGDPACEHDFENTATRRKGSTNGRGDLGSTLISVDAPKTLAPGLTNDQVGTAQYRTDHSAFCQKCNAWRGSVLDHNLIDAVLDDAA